MNSISSCPFVCACSDCEHEHDIGVQCGATATDKTVKVPVTVMQPLNQQNPPNCTKQLEVGSRPKYTSILKGSVSKRKVAPVAEIVRKLADPPVPDTAIQVIGTVTLDPINYQEFVSTFNASRKCEQ